jgi:hypothetical protein
MSGWMLVTCQPFQHQLTGSDQRQISSVPFQA